MNHRTDSLANCCSCMKKHSQRKSKLDQVKLKMNAGPTELAVVTADFNEAQRFLEESQTEFKKFSDSLVKESVLLEKEKAKDFSSAIKSFVQIELSFEKERLVRSKDLLQTLKEIEI